MESELRDLGTVDFFGLLKTDGDRERVMEQIDILQREVDRPTRLLQFVAFVHSPFCFRSLDLFQCSFTLV